MTSPFSPAAFRLTDLLQDAASRAVAVDPRDLNSPRGNLALLGDMNYRRQADGRYEAQPQIDALGVTEARASGAYMLEEWNGNHAAPAGRLVSFGPNQLRAGRLGVIRETAAVTNQVPNPRGLGARVGTLTGGSPTGALPTGWGFVTQGGVTWTLVDYALVNGVERVTIRFSGTASGNIALAFNSTTSAVWGAATQKTVAVNARLASGSLTNMGTARVIAAERDAAGGAVSVTPANLRVLDAIDRRYHVTRTRTGGTGGHIQLQVQFLSASGAVDCTVEFSLPQAQDGTVASHPVITHAGADPAASTKAASTFTPATALNTRSTRRSAAGGWNLQNGGLLGGQVSERLPLNTVSDGARYQFAPATTNHFNNPNGEGAVAGSPGAAPTNWARFLQSGGQLNVAAADVELSGWRGVNVTFGGTAGASLRFGGATDIIASSGQSWTGSVTLIPLTEIIGVSARLVVQERDASGSVLTVHGQPSFTVGASARRLSYTVTLTNASTARVTLVLEFFSGGSSGTLFVGGVQMEQRAFPTPFVSPPRGTIATSTATADALAIPVSSWLPTLARGTMVAEFVMGATGYPGAFGGTHVWDFYLNNNNTMRLRVDNTSGQVSAQRVVGGVTQTLAGESIAAGDVVRAVVSWSGGTGKLCVNGGLIVSGTFDPAALVPASLRAFRELGSATLTTGFINELSYIPVALTDAQIVALSRL